jgi:hypothetical protein
MSSSHDEVQGRFDRQFEPAREGGRRRGKKRAWVSWRAREDTGEIPKNPIVAWNSKSFLTGVRAKGLKQPRE